MEDVKWEKKVASFLSAKFGKKYQASALVKNNREGVHHEVIMIVFPANESVYSDCHEACYGKAVA